MNFGNIMYDIVFAILTFASKIGEIINTKIDISKLKDTISIIGFNVDFIPNEIGILSILGSFGGLAIITIMAYKLIK